MNLHELGTVEVISELRARSKPVAEALQVRRAAALREAHSP